MRAGSRCTLILFLLNNPCSGARALSAGLFCAIDRINAAGGALFVVYTVLLVLFGTVV